ncbi:MAG: L-seryl-tRNA(Sec) selenium transferase [Planctomycetota bacterium]
MHAMNADETQDALRNLPAVDYLLGQPAVGNLLDEYPRAELLAVVRTVLDRRRAAIRAGQTVSTDIPSLALDIRQELYERSLPHLRRVVNATGIVLHTGLGRAPLAREAVEAIAEVAAGYCNLELDIETGRRGDRHEHARELLREITGAEDGVVVNNNAAGTYLALNTLAAGREVIVSRGQLVEIGGSYRMPDIMAAAQCRMVEVGTTNRTHLADYERAIGDETAILLHVHTSNYRVQGFVTSPSLAELVKLGRKYNLLVVDDLGSGLMASELPHLTGLDSVEDDGTDMTPEPRWDEPTVRGSLTDGADLTLFSGDKLLGGPQAGLIVGRADLIDRLRKNPVMRTYRPGKLTLAGIEATLRLYRDEATLRRRLPVYRMLTSGLDELETMARDLAEQIRDVVPSATIECERDESLAGGGSLPLTRFETWVVSVRHDELECGRLATAMRQRAMPIICRLHEGALVFDCRTLVDDDAEQIAGVLAELARDLLST